jgi:hypothetical protein
MTGSGQPRESMRLDRHLLDRRRARRFFSAANFDVARR